MTDNARQGVRDSKVRYILDRYLGKIKSHFAPAQVWVWGSRVYGLPHEFSDVDMVIVSERFQGVPFWKRRQLFRDATGIAEDPSAEVVDVLCYTPAEFQDRSSSPTVVREAVRRGARVA